MSKIYGPYDAGDWYLMKQLRESINWYRKNPTRYALAMKKEQTLLKDYYRKEVA